jgi:hypothetical protein
MILPATATDWGPVHGATIAGGLTPFASCPKYWTTLVLNILACRPISSEVEAQLSSSPLGHVFDAV